MSAEQLAETNQKQTTEFAKQLNRIFSVKFCSVDEKLGLLDAIKCSVFEAAGLTDGQLESEGRQMSEPTALKNRSPLLTPPAQSLKMCGYESLATWSPTSARLPTFDLPHVEEATTPKVVGKRNSHLRKREVKELRKGILVQETQWPKASSSMRQKVTSIDLKPNMHSLQL